MGTKDSLPINHEQRGFTLIELLVVIAVSAVILPVSVAGVYLINKDSQVSNNRLAAINSVQNAGEWIIKDTRMAVSVSDAGNFTVAYPLNLTWTGYHSGNTTVIYSINAANELNRNSTFNGNLTTTVVARYIDPSGTNYTFQNDTLTFSIKAKTGSGASQVIESRTYQASPRN